MVWSNPCSLVAVPVLTHSGWYGVILVAVVGPTHLLVDIIYGVEVSGEDAGEVERVFCYLYRYFFQSLPGEGCCHDVVVTSRVVMVT